METVFFIVFHPPFFFLLISEFLKLADLKSLIISHLAVFFLLGIKAHDKGDKDYEKNYKDQRAKGDIFKIFLEKIGNPARDL